MATFRIENEHLVVGVDSLGAEIISIRAKSDGLEYLCEADKDIFPYHAPVLFPVIGEVENNRYTYRGKEYSMGIHGFARHKEFELIENNEQSITLTLRSSKETMEVYPFEFELRTRITINGNRIEVFRCVSNTGEKTMFFSIGEHPAFRCPLLPGERPEDYFLKFEKTETQDALNHNTGFLDGKRRRFLEAQNELQLTPEVFSHKAIVLQGVKSEYVGLKTNTHNRQIGLRFRNFPTLTIWALKERLEFVCIEPWFGCMPYKNGGSDIEQRNGIMALEPNKDFAYDFCFVVD
jgi:galactose mutarotase-like enzyme